MTSLALARHRWTRRLVASAISAVLLASAGVAGLGGTAVADPVDSSASATPTATVADVDDAATPQPSPSPSLTRDDPETPEPTPGPTASSEPTPTPEPTDPDEDDEIDDPDTGWADLPLSGRAVLSLGHMDILSTVTTGALRVDIHDDSTVPASAHEVDEATFYAAPGSHLESPALSQVFGAGVDEAWVLPQTQDYSLVWPGWNVSPTGTQVTWTLDEVRGPGQFALFETVGFGDIRVLLSDEASPRSFSYREHAHGSWGFTRQGVYCLDSTYSAGTGAQRRADSVTVLIGVGDVDPERVTEAMCGKTPEQIVAGDSRPQNPPTAVPASALTAAARGPVRVARTDLDTSGGTVRVQVGAEQAGRWVSVWWYSTPRHLGWVRADSDGWVQVEVPSTTAGAHKVAALSRDGALIGWAPVSIRAPQQTPDPAPAPAPPPGPGPAPATVAQEVCIPTPITRQVSASDATIAASGHFDYGPQLIGGQLVSRVKNDSGTWVDPAGLVLHVSDSARGTVPAGYEFLGPAGSTIWRIPETQASGVPWLGWNTQHSSITSGISGPVTFTLSGVDGPGQLIVYMSGTFGGAVQRVFDTVGGPRAVTVPLNTHQHADWVFTQPGVYRVTITQTATTTSGQQVSTAGTLHVFVGSGDPRAAAASTTVTDWVGRTASGAECALSDDQRAAIGATGADDEALTARSVTQAAAVAAVFTTPDDGDDSEPVTDDSEVTATTAPTESGSDLGRTIGLAVLSALAILALAGAAMTTDPRTRPTGRPRRWTGPATAVLLVAGLGLGGAAVAIAATGPESAPVTVATPVPTADPSPSRPAPTPSATPEVASTVDLVDAAWSARVAEQTGIPTTALAAYAGAALRLEQEQPGCHLGWNTLAAIGQVESEHGTAGGSALTEDGVATPAILGLPLNGSGGRASIPDTDAGALDGDTRWDRAVGPMQFIPESWSRWATDGDGDGVTDPQNIVDAALSAGRYLCDSGDLADPDTWIAAIASYNDDLAYNNAVADAADRYATAG